MLIAENYRGYIDLSKEEAKSIQSSWDKECHESCPLYNLCSKIECERLSKQLSLKGFVKSKGLKLYGREPEILASSLREYRIKKTNERNREEIIRSSKLIKNIEAFIQEQNIASA